MTDPHQPLRGERDLARLLAGMTPALDAATYVFCRPPRDASLEGLTPRGVFEEREGRTLILEADQASRAGLTPDFVARRIELTVQSDLAAVGFLARVSAELAAAGIPCNPVSAAFHDHLFVPVALAQRAMEVLERLALEARAAQAPVMYTVTVRVDRAAAPDWLQWMESVHVPEIMATGCFRRCTVERLTDEPDQPRVGWRLAYQARSAEALARYRSEFAPALQQAHTERYAGRFEATREVHPTAFEHAGPLA